MGSSRAAKTKSKLPGATPFAGMLRPSKSTSIRNSVKANILLQHLGQYFWNLVGKRSLDKFQHYIKQVFILTSNILAENNSEVVVKEGGRRYVVGKCQHPL